VKEIKVGVIGFGTVGAGVVEILLTNGEVISKRAGIDLKLVRIADLDTTTDRGVKVPEGVLIPDASQAIRDCDVIVELIGGTTVARKFILEALNAGKPVVTANKALLALHGPELFAAAEKSGVDLCYEASVAGGIPIIKALREGLSANRINRIYGIMNGTCNYILTRMEREGADFAPILADAQRLGYAEANPSLDIDGFDTAHKTAILAALAYGRWFGLDPIRVEGIRDLSLDDLHYADELGYRIKLLSIIKSHNGKIQMRVHPTLIPKHTLLAEISDVFNGVLVDGDFVDQTLFYGRGAGRRATASAVVADLVDIARNIASGSPRRIPAFRPGELFTEVETMDDIESRYYLRLQVEDCPGVIASITKVLADNGISISSMIQHESKAGDGVVPLVILTHPAVERSMMKAISAIDNEKFNRAPVRMLRIEDL